MGWSQRMGSIWTEMSVQEANLRQLGQERYVLQAKAEGLCWAQDKMVDAEIEGISRQIQV